jgi:hypothetical protein
MIYYADKELISQAYRADKSLTGPFLKGREE